MTQGVNVPPVKGAILLAILKTVGNAQIQRLASKSMCSGNFKGPRAAYGHVKMLPLPLVIPRAAFGTHTTTNDVGAYPHRRGRDRLSDAIRSSFAQLQRKAKPKLWAAANPDVLAGMGKFIFPGDIGSHRWRRRTHYQRDSSGDKNPFHTGTPILCFANFKHKTLRSFLAPYQETLVDPFSYLDNNVLSETTMENFQRRRAIWR